MKQFFLTMLAAVAALAGNAQATVPADAVVESWLCSFVMHTNNVQGEETERVSEPMDVAFAGQEVYFNLPNPISGNTWVKGTVADNSATFASGQLLGDYGGDVFMVGQNAQGLADVVFSYDAARGLFTLTDMHLVLSGSATEVDAWAYYTDMTVSRGGDVHNDDGTIAPPADATIESWTLSGRNVNPYNEAQYEELSEAVQVAFAGSNIYIKGLCPAEGWLKGTVSGDKATFAQRQYLGKAEGYQFYAIGYEGNGAIDIVFSYNAEQGVLTTNSYILLINEQDQALMMFTNVVMTRSDKPVVADDQPIEAPANLATNEYVFKGTSIDYNADGTIAGMSAVQWNVRVGFATNNEVYIQGLFTGLPEAWVKGTLSDGELTLASGQFYGSHPQLQTLRFYFGAMRFGELADEMELTYDGTAGTFSGGSYYMVVNSSKTELAPYNVYAGVSISRVASVAAVPAKPSVEEYAPYNAEYKYGYVCFNLPTTDVDGNAINRDLMDYQMYYVQNGQQHVYRFTTDLYNYLAADTETIAYFWADGYDFYRGGSFVALYQESMGWQKIGVQTVYKGGGKVNRSEIAWRDINTQGIEAAEKPASVVSETFTDLQGRAATAATRGLVISQQRLSDGSVKAVKRFSR